MRKIAIIGGAGPQAGALLYKKIIDRYSSYGAWQDHEFPYIVLFSVPFAPMMEATTHGAYITSQLQQVVDYSVFMGIQEIVIACNTLHIYINNIDWKGIVFHSLIDATIKSTMEYMDRILVLSTNSTKMAMLYPDQFGFYYPDLKDVVFINSFIEMVLKQQDTPQLVAPFFDYINKQDHPVLLGCTELSVLYNNYKTQTTRFIIDPFDCIIEDMFYRV